MSCVTVTVTAWGVFQVVVEKVRLDGEKVGLIGLAVEEPAPRLRLSVTLAAGWAESLTV